MDITGRPLDQLLLSEMTAEIGCIRKTLQTPEVFNEENLGTWMLMNGQSCTGTLYESKFGTTVVPDAYTNGAFLRQAKANRDIGSYEEDALQGHEHALESWYGDNGDGSKNPNNQGYGGAGPYGESILSKQIISKTGYDSVRIANENRPKNIAVNFMIKVDHN